MARCVELSVVLPVLLALVGGQDVIVDIEYGQVQGKTINVNNGRENKTVHSFHGIPFAQDTSGPRRFTNPEPVDPWTDVVFVADVPGDACPQTGTLGTTHPDWERYSEDCLHVDIVSPDVTGGPYPVMVWIYGGGYQSGANFAYPGHFLATRDVVVVTVNYRLGRFGFAYTGNAAAPGNAGLWDQRMGIEFVINNIANFGGDPDRITVFGQSAGGGSASLHLLSPQSKDLFQQAIMISGAETNIWVVNPPESNPEDYTQQIAEDMNCVNEDDFVMMDCLREKTWEDLHFNSSISCAPGYICMGMAPVVDGPGGFLPEKPADLRASGDIMRGPIITGITQEDGALFVPAFVPEALFGCCNRTYYLAALDERIVGMWDPLIDNITHDNIFHAMDYNYSPWPHVYDRESNREAFIKMLTDAALGLPWDTQAKGHSEIANTWAYIYDYRGENGVGPDWMGATHGADTPYVFGWTLLEQNEEVRNDSLIFEITGYSQADREYTMFVQDLYTNFAKFGNPTPQPVDNPFGGATTWPQFSFDEMNILHLTNTDIHVMQQYEQKNYAFWREHMDYLVNGVTDAKHGGTGFPSELFAAALANDLDLYPSMFEEFEDY